MLSIFKLIFSCFIASIALANAQDLTCFEAGECRQSFHLGGDDSETQLTCLELCKANSDCNWFTFFPSLGYCEMFHNCTEINTEFCQDCISGESGCIVEPTCFVPGECQGNVDHIEEADSQESCLAQCQSQEGCEWFTYHNTTSACILFFNCESISTECHECVSGENECQSGSKSVYLVGGSSPNEGNVYAINPLTGIDGPVCDDLWDYKDASVVCRQLGFDDAEQVYSYSHFGVVPSLFSYDNLECYGYEESIAECLHDRSDNCGGTEGAGVRCSSSVSPTTTTTESSGHEVSLVGGQSENEGNVFARNPTTGIYGPVCDDGWSFQSATVVCRQLGYNRAEEATIQSFFGEVSNDFSYDNVNCNGDEVTLDDCQHSQSEDCVNTEGAGVICA